MAAAVKLMYYATLAWFIQEMVDFLEEAWTEEGLYS